jgi:hypothetical protein
LRGETLRARIVFVELICLQVNPEGCFSLARDDTIVIANDSQIHIPIWKYHKSALTDAGNDLATMGNGGSCPSLQLGIIGLSLPRIRTLRIDARRDLTRRNE